MHPQCRVFLPQIKFLKQVPLNSLVDLGKGNWMVNLTSGWTLRRLFEATLGLFCSLCSAKQSTSLKEVITVTWPNIHRHFTVKQNGYCILHLSIIIFTKFNLNPFTYLLSNFILSNNLLNTSYNQTQEDLVGRII